MCSETNPFVNIKDLGVFTHSISTKSMQLSIQQVVQYHTSYVYTFIYIFVSLISILGILNTLTD